MTEQLNLWKAALQVAFDQTCSVGRPNDWKLIKDALASVNYALTHPAQPAEGGEAVYQIRRIDGSWYDAPEAAYRMGVELGADNGRVLYTTPPASQEQVECAKAAHDALMTGTGFMRNGKHIPLDQVFADPPKGSQARASAGGFYAIAYEWDEPGDCVHRSFRYYPRNGRYPDRSVKLFTASQEQADPCGACNGSGWVVRDPDIGTDQECFVCDGSGKAEASQEQAQQPSTVTLYASPVQLAAAMRGELVGMDTDSYRNGGFGAYLPVRHTPAGKFTQAVTLTSGQQPSGGEVVAWRLRAPVESCGLQRFMTQAKYEKQTPAIQKWYEPFNCQNCATTKPEPMPETLRVWANSPELVEDGNRWQEGYEHARAWVHVQLSVTSTITKEQA